MLLRNAFVVFALALSVQPDSFAAEPGITDDSVTVGIVTSLTGPVGGTGKLIMAGYEAAFKRANGTSGVNGRKIQISSFDDKYEPKMTADLSEQVIKSGKAFVLAGYNGTSTSRAAYPVATKAGVPFLFPRTGDNYFRTHHRSVFNLRPSFDDEVALMIKYVASLEKKRISIVYQSDAFGDALRVAAVNSMAAQFKVPAQKGDAHFASFSRVPRDASGDKVIEEIYDRISKGKPEVVILATSLAISAPFVRLAEKKKANWIFLSVSSTNNLADKLADTDAEVVFSQVVPNPYDSDGLALIGEFKDDMTKAGFANEIGYSSLESYLNGRVIAEAVRRAGADPTRLAFIRAIENGPFQIGGLTLSWSEINHNSDAKVYLSKGKRGKFTTVPVNF